MPTPNKWNPNTTTVYSSRGSAKEIPIGDYDKYISAGWGASAPTAPKVEPVVNKVSPTAPPAGQGGYWRTEGTDEVYDQSGKHITAEEAKGIPDFWSQVEVKPPTTPTEISTDVLDTPITTEDIQAQVSSPIEGLQEVFGEGWTPAPIFDQLGLTEQGIYGAVRIKGMNDVYTIGEGGRRETAESYLERFGTDSQEGIVGEISMEEAKALGITIGADSIIEPIIPKDPFEVWEHFRDEDKAEIDEMRKTLTDATKALIDQMKDYGEDKAEAKDAEKEKLRIDAKDKAITDAEKTYADAMQVYSEVLLKNRSTSGAMSRILGTESRITAQRAIEMAPLSANILIAQNSYDRAKDLLDDWSDDYAESMKWQMSAAQLNIDLLTGELNREQAENLEDAKIKFKIWTDEENRRLDTAEEVKKLMLAFNSRGANININDDFETAMKKIMPLTKSDQDILDRLNELKLESAEVGLLLQKKSLAKPYSTGTGTDTTKIDYSSPLLSLYTQTTGKMVSNKAQAQQIAGLAQTALAGREVVADNLIGPLSSSQIRESEAANIIRNAFQETFGDKSEDEWTPELEQSFLNMGLEQSFLNDLKAIGFSPKDLGKEIL